MGARAIIEWHQPDSELPALLQRNPWLSPSTFLPALADFVHTARVADHAPSAELFQGWAVERVPYVLGEDETRDRMLFLTPGSDVQFHYLVQLTEDDQPAGRALRVTVREKKPFQPGVGGRWEVIHQAGTDEELFELAAGILERRLPASADSQPKAAAGRCRRPTRSPTAPRRSGRASASPPKRTVVRTRPPGA